MSFHRALRFHPGSYPCPAESLYRASYCFTSHFLVRKLIVRLLSSVWVIPKPQSQLQCLAPDGRWGTEYLRAEAGPLLGAKYNHILPFHEMLIAWNLFHIVCFAIFECKHFIWSLQSLLLSFWNKKKKWFHPEYALFSLSKIFSMLAIKNITWKRKISPMKGYI